MVQFLPVVVQFLFPLLIFLFPIGIYLTVLAGINRHPHPIMVPGTWDAVGLLFASSGFLLAIGPAILRELYQRLVMILTTQASDSPLLDVLNQWGLLWGVYYGLLTVTAFLFLLGRRHMLVIYNVDQTTFHQVLAQVLERLQIVPSRQGRRLFLWKTAPDVMVSLPGDPSSSAADAAKGVVASDQPLPMADPESNLRSLPRTDSRLSLTVDPFASLFNITLRWQGSDEHLQLEVEEELRKSLPSVYTRDNPLGGWFFSMAGGIFGIMIVGVLLLFIMIFVSRAQ
jgi:hypothetical protein